MAWREISLVRSLDRLRNVPHSTATVHVMDPTLPVSQAGTHLKYLSANWNKRNFQMNPRIRVCFNVKNSTCLLAPDLLAAGKLVSNGLKPGMLARNIGSYGLEPSFEIHDKTVYNQQSKDENVPKAYLNAGCTFHGVEAVRYITFRSAIIFE